MASDIKGYRAFLKIYIQIDEREFLFREYLNSYSDN